LYKINPKLTIYFTIRISDIMCFGCPELLSAQTK